MDIHQNHVVQKFILSLWKVFFLSNVEQYLAIAFVARRFITIKSVLNRDLKMKQVDNIYLIGLMGAGKTTIGRQLAKALQLPFYDSDKAIEEQTGVDIPTIFEYEGEEGFRQREQNMIQDLTQIKGIVLATGGGVIIREQNRQALKKNGFVIYLQCSVDKIVQRTKRDTQRPLLFTDNPRERIEQLFLERDSYYSSCADFIIETSNWQSKTVVNNILKEYKSRH